MATTTSSGYQHGAPFDAGFLQVDSIHRIHYEQYGKENGIPVLFVHGGPGGSASVKNTVVFNPAVYRVVLFDQRGCGQSHPLGETRQNTSKHLVEDIDALRRHVRIERWHVFGASWGTTVSMLYAQTFPEAVASLTLRGVSFFEAQEDIDFNAAFERTRLFRPEIYGELIAHLTEEERDDIAGSYAARFSCGDHAVEIAAMKLFNRWGGLMSKLIPSDEESDSVLTEAEERRMVARNRIEWHYHANNLWLKEMQYLETENLEKVKHIPCTIVNGRYDLICPPFAAWKLHKLLPRSQVFIIPDAGHSAFEPGIQRELISICDNLAFLPI